MSYYHLHVDNIDVGQPLDSHNKYGIHLRIPSEVEVQRAKDDASDEGYPITVLEITDNGKAGDGLYLAIRYEYAANPLVSFQVPDSSIDSIIAALQAVKAMRAAE